MGFTMIFAAVMAANMLTVAFVWGLYAYSRSEREGTAGQPSTHKAALAAIAPLAITAVFMMAAFDKTPDWLNTILQ